MRFSLLGATLAAALCLCMLGAVQSFGVSGPALSAFSPSRTPLCHRRYHFAPFLSLRCFHSCLSRQDNAKKKSPRFLNSGGRMTIVFMQERKLNDECSTVAARSGSARGRMSSGC
eukprot:1299210-Rhodomonas_salina.1